jgi:hypothetical protein
MLVKKPSGRRQHAQDGIKRRQNRILTIQGAVDEEKEVIESSAETFRCATIVIDTTNPAGDGRDRMC